MPFSPELRELFDSLRAGRARQAAQSWDAGAVLDTRLPPVGTTRTEGEALRRTWLRELDRWHFLEGSLSPLLLLSSRLWGLLVSAARDDASGVAEPRAVQQSLRDLLLQAFPALVATEVTVRQVLAVVAGQGALDRLDARAWAAWPPALQQEGLRLLKWRELRREVPPGQAARCHAALSTAVPWRWPQPLERSGAPQAALAGLGAWPFGREVLEGSHPDVRSPEWVLFGWSLKAVLEPADTAVACLVACLRLRGHAVNSGDLQAQWPFGTGSVTAEAWRRACRRMGLQTREVSVTQLAGDNLPALCRLNDGSCVLVLAAAPEGFRLLAPGVHFPYRLVERHRLPAERVAFACAVQGEGRTEFLARRPLRRLRFEVLAGHDGQGAMADPRSLSALQAEAALWPDGGRQPPPIATMGVDELMAAHRSLADAGSPFHGRFRRINLQASTELLRWEHIPAAIWQWLERARDAPGSTDAALEAITIAALYMDFLRIHPFLNGNRRLGMVLAGALAQQHGWQLDWTGLSRVQVYHAVRCAAAGHPGVLRAAIARCLRPLDG